MATYYVDGKNGNDNSGNGNSNNPWKSLKKAHDSIKAGDTVKIRTAVYKETLNIDVANSTWMADDGHQPVMDGGYHEGLFRNGELPPPGGYLPGSTYGAMIRPRGNNITIDGLTIQNVAGVAISIPGERATVRNCKVDFVYGGGMSITGGSKFIAGPLVENNTFTRCSMKIYDPVRDEHAGPASVQGTLSMRNAENCIIRHNICGYSYGEGITMGAGTLNSMVEGNVVHTCNHVHIYFTRCRGCVARNNFVYHTYQEEFLGSNGLPPSGIVFGDERAGASRFGNSANNYAYNNIVVGMDRNLEIRNTAANYDTQLIDSYIGYNTFVSGRLTRFGVQFKENLQGRAHTRTIFENNIILQYNGEIGDAKGNMSGITFRNNLWSEQPDAALRGPNDSVGDPRLADPRANISGTAPNPTNADPFNYRLTKNSTLAIGGASDGSKVNGMQPPEVERDFFNGNRDNRPDLGSHEYGGEVAQISANFSIGPSQQQGVAPHTVDFVDKSSSTSPITKWSWDFGDGSTSTESNPSHTYMAPGVFTVALSIEDASGQKDSVVKGDLITSLPDVPLPTSEEFRRFILVEDVTENVIAFGTQFPDYSCVMLWNDDPYHILNYASIEDVAASFVVDGKTSLLWLDPSTEEVSTNTRLTTEAEIAEDSWLTTVTN